MKTFIPFGYLVGALSKGIPVVVGVDNRPGSPNTDNSTDHFIVIVGMGTEPDGRKYFQFFDSSTENTFDGASRHNKLYYNSTSGKVSGKSYSPYASYPGTHNYIMTQVRKSKRKN